MFVVLARCAKRNDDEGRSHLTKGRNACPEAPPDPATLANVLRELSGHSTLAAVVDRALTLGLELGGAMRGAILLYRDGSLRVAGEAQSLGGTAVVRISDGPGSAPTDYAAAFDEVARTGVPLVRQAAVARAPSIACLPAIAEGDLVGAIYLESSAPRPFTATELEILAFLAEQTAHAIRRAGVFAEIQDAEERERRQADDLAHLFPDPRTLLDAVPQQIFVLRADMRLEYANKAVRDYHGEDLSRVLFDDDVDRRDRMLHHPDDLPHLREQGLHSVVHGVPLDAEGRLLGKDGQYRWFLIRLNPYRDEAGHVVRWYGTRTDIDARRQAEERVRQDGRQLRMLVDFVPDQLLMLDPLGHILYANKAALDYTGLTLEDVVTREDVWPAIMHPDDMPTVRATLEGIAAGIGGEVEIRIRRHDGEHRWHLGRNAPLRDEDGRIIHWFASGTDIDDRKRAEQRVKDWNVALVEEVDKASMFEEIVGSSSALRRVLTSVAQVAPTDSTVLVTGETGTGKELVARAIHKRSQRAARPFVSVNCAAIPPALIASELFGHEKGAFTGALQRRIGRFELADGGTIFLDEVGDLPPDAQMALLRVLQEREFERVGSTRPIKVDVRVIAATNRDLASAMATGGFRQDLYYRLNVFPIELPALRDRASDIPLLVVYFTQRYADRIGKTIRAADEGTMELIQSYRWPGNVRELQNVIERAVIICQGDTLTIDQSWIATNLPPTPVRPLADELIARERQLIEAALAESAGRVSGAHGAAARLGIPSTTLESKIRTLGIKKHRFKGD